LYYRFKKYLLKISGKSSYDMISGIKEFYDTLPEGKAPVQSDGRYSQQRCIGDVTKKRRDGKQIAPTHHDDYDGFKQFSSDPAESSGYLT
jgi:hypothetical protein